MINPTYFLLALAFALSAVRMSAQQFFFSAEKPASCAANDGIVTIVPTQGVPPFTYEWSTGATGLSLYNITKGNYSATLTDATGASVVHTHILNSKELDLFLSNYKPATFCNSFSGALAITVLGGQPPYAITWSNGQTGAAVQGLTTGVYTVTVLDATGCEAAGVFEVKDPADTYYPTAYINALQLPDCANATNGALQAGMFDSGYPPYSYAWSNGATGETITSLASGTYTVTVTDALGCPRAASMTVDKGLKTTGSSVCAGGSGGTASAELAGATAPVSYTWSTGQTGPALSNLGNGTYFVTATDANGCSASGAANVSIPQLDAIDYSTACYSGNNGIGSCLIYNDEITACLWDNGVTETWNPSLSPGMHSVTVTTALGCTLSASVTIAPPIAPPMEINYTVSQADCANGIGGVLNVSITGGAQPYNFYATNYDGFSSNSISSLQNLQSGKYYLGVSSKVGGEYCYTNNSAVVPDAGGFEPTLMIEAADCVTGFSSAAVLNVTMPGVQYDWSMGATTPDVYNLTSGCYAVTVTGAGSCIKYFDFCMGEDSSRVDNSCYGLVSGKLVNDLDVPGCNGTTGIPFQMIRTLPSGALNFTDKNGLYQVNLPAGTFDIKPASYDPADIACPPNGFYTVNITAGTMVSDMDFHFFNTNPTDHRVRQRALRTAQPGYPYSLRFEVCNDGNSATNGSVDIEYGNFLGNMNAASFTQHPGAFSFVSETAGIPDNSTSYSFPGVAPGSCELIQADFVTPATTPVNTEFITRATVTPPSGDPTPDNNSSTLFNTVMGSFDPNSVYAFPARNGNPHDGGDILRNVDREITYQIFFQNTGNAPANLVIVRDTLDPRLNVSTIRNISASHDMKVSLEDQNNVLVFTFPNINLPDSTSDYANSIGSIQYEIDLQPGLSVGTEVAKQAAIYFDFNSPVITNNNVLRIINTNSEISPGIHKNAVVTFPNPADQYFGFYADTAGVLSVFNALGALVSEQKIETGLQRVTTTDFPSGIYLIRLDAGGNVRNGKVVVSH